MMIREAQDILARPVLLVVMLATASLYGCAGPDAADQAETAAVDDVDVATDRSTRTLRVAVFNVKELSREKLDRVDEAGAGIDPQLRAAAEVVQRMRPDLLLLNEIDYDDARENADLFRQRYLTVPQGGQEPIDFADTVFLPVNTGVPSGLDLNQDGDPDGPEDAWGFGRYPGQYGMALYSQGSVDPAAIRTFQTFRWADMPGHHMPDGVDGRPSWYPAAQAAQLRLSSKSHWDVPITVDGATVHLLASHPTPPVFDGDEDRNGRRNFDEVRLWADYLTGGETAAYLYDDQGGRGGLDAGAHFVVLGDLNADPYSDRVDGVEGPAIAQLLAHPRVQDPAQRGAGGAFVDRPYDGDPETRTAAFGRADYVLPSRSLEVTDAGLFWPPPDDPLHALVVGEGASSDHRLVWVDLSWPPQ